jgi:CRP-like cAMP-binding protein
MYREDTGHSIYESEEFKYQEEEENPNKHEDHDDQYKAKNNAALRDLDLLMSDKAKHDQGSLEKTGVPDFRQFDPEKFDVGVAKFIYLMSKYDPKKSKVDPYGPEVDDETKFIYDYSLLFYAQIERPDKYYRAGKFHYRPVRRFKRGEYFGEAGMIVSQPRTETAIAAGEVLVAYIPRKKTLTRFPQIMSIMEFRMKYLIPFFKVINHVYVVKLCAAMKEEYYDHGAMIFQQGQKLSGFYIIIEGEVELVKDITVNKYLINNHQSMHSFKTRRYLV